MVNLVTSAEETYLNKTTFIGTYTSIRSFSELMYTSRRIKNVQINASTLLYQFFFFPPHFFSNKYCRISSCKFEKPLVATRPKFCLPILQKLNCLFLLLSRPLCTFAIYHIHSSLKFSDYEFIC